MFLTSDQLFCRVSDAAAGLSYSFDRDGVALSTEQPFQITVGGVRLTGYIEA